MKKTLLDILVCPLCKRPLVNCGQPATELHCRPCGLAYPIKDGIPVMLEFEARTLTTDERLGK